MPTESKLANRFALGLFGVVAALLSFVMIEMINAADLSDKTGFRQDPIPVGSIMAMSGITGGMAIPASGTVNSRGWMLADGAVIPAGNVATGNTPNLVDQFIRGAASAGGTGGADSDSITLLEANLPAHDHTQAQMNVTVQVNKTEWNSDQVAHNHSLDGHTHSMQNHTHSLQSHTHNMSNHTHSVSAASSSHTHTAGGYYAGVGVLAAGGGFRIRSDSTIQGGISDHPGNGSFGLGGGGASGNDSVNFSRVAGTSGNPSATISATGGPSTNNSDGPSNNTSGTPSVANTGGPSSNDTLTNTATWNSSVLNINGNTTTTPVTSSVGSGTAFNVDTIPAYYAVVYLVKVR